LFAIAILCSSCALCVAANGYVKNGTPPATCPTESIAIVVKSTWCAPSKEAHTMFDPLGAALELLENPKEVFD
jgi:hypothetical protein